MKKKRKKKKAVWKIPMIIDFNLYYFRSGKETCKHAGMILQINKKPSSIIS